MMPHPAAWFDNPPPPTAQEHTVWKKWLKKLAGWILQYGPGLTEAVIAAKAKGKL